MDADQSYEADLEALKAAQPSWRADNLGVRGNPIEFHREQAKVDWPNAGLSRRSGTVTSAPAQAGAPEPRESVPAV